MLPPFYYSSLVCLCAVVAIAVTGEMVMVALSLSVLAATGAPSAVALPKLAFPTSSLTRELIAFPGIRMVTYARLGTIKIS